MPNSVAKRRSRFAILAAFAVVASLFTAALPASAATGDVEFPATYSACVAGATADAGFSDTAGSFADASIDCLKYYGITTGTSATTYSPGAGVTRWQMALFLIRAAGPAGITVPAATGQGFTDIADLPQGTQDAINQLAALSISKGTSATTYGPNDVVSRYQMALFLIRFLEVQNGTASLSASTSASGLTDTGSVSNEAFLAIEQAWDHGITKGTSATAFSPYGAVTREQMAAFIGRTLAHTNARPAGVTIQSDIASGFGLLNPILSISVRDASFQPVVNAQVDIFKFEPSTTVTSAFATDGTCVTTGEVTAVSSGANACKIDLTDNVTNSSGNIPTWGWTVTSGKVGTFYAWTGTTGATFDNDTTASDNVVVTSALGALSTVASWNLPANASIDTSRSVAKFGTVTYTFQLNDAVDGSGDPVAQANQTITYSYTLTTASGSVSGTGLTLTTDANGSATVSFTATDPNVATGDTATLDFTFTSGPGAEVLDMADEDVVFKDAAAAETTVVVATATEYAIAASGGVANTVTASVYDQYGAAFAATVNFTSDDAAGVGGTAVQRSTVGGIATLVYSRTGTVSSAETITATVGALTPTTVFYWAKVGVADPTMANSQAIITIDAANNRLLVGPIATAAEFGGAVGEYVELTYKDSDQFNAPTPMTAAQFEAAVVGGTSTLDAANYAPTGTSSFTVTP